MQQQVSTAADQLVDVIQRLHRRGWCDGTGGNFSLVLEREPLRLLMAPSGVDKGRVQADQLIQVNRDGAVVDGSGVASAETLLHLRIIHDCQAGAVLHTHSLTATLLSRQHQSLGGIHLEGWEMLKGLAGVTTHATSVQIPIIANHQNLELLSQNAAEHLPNAAHGLLVAGHGLYAWGETLEAAQRHVEILEFLLNLHWRQQLLHLSNA
ncbi:methylthioribulose-1-phosphate dehydratase [Synechococcus sp. RS9909]|nr:methylthioribulose-1-phosphate dehydratase [Synechococcus sp. RS9909]